MTRISKKRTVARVRWSRGGRKASATGVKVAGIGTSNIKAKELDSPLARGAGVISGSIPKRRVQLRLKAWSAKGRRLRRAEGPVA